MPQPAVQTPRVPIQTPMFDANGLLTRTWVIFFERLGRVTSTTETVTPGAGGKGPFQRTLLLKNTAIGIDIADHVTVYEPGEGIVFTGVLRKAISEDLTVRLKKNGAAIITLTIPAGTAIDTVVSSTGFAATPQPFVEGEVLSWDVTASDESTDVNGVASFTVEWAPPAEETP